MFKIETNIPVPNQSKGYNKYPFAAMAYGDSFLVPCEAKDVTNTKKSIAISASNFLRINEITYCKFVCHEVPAIGVRCWKIAITRNA